MLELRGVQKRWTDFALKGVSLHVREGEYFVLLGPSGAGKSLLLEVVAGFHRPDAGRIMLHDRDVTSLPPERRKVGFVYQDSMLFPHRSVAQNIAYGLQGDRTQARRRVEELSDMLRIGQLLERSPETLSGGEKQRAAIARALAVEPDVLLMDEPLSALDPPTQQALRGELLRVHGETGVTVLHVTHDQAEAREMGERVGILRDGRLVQVGTGEEVFQRPENGFVAAFTGCDNILPGTARLRDGVTEVRCGDAEVVATDRRTGPVRAAIRPENIIISTEPVRTSARNQFRGRVVSVTPRGRTFAVTGEFDGMELTALVTAQSLEELSIAPDAEVYFSFKASSMHLMPAEEATDD
jgi:molybdopterin-binding protein